MARITVEDCLFSVDNQFELVLLAAKRAREEERTLARFLREMELARVVDHPHVTKTNCTQLW